MGIRLEVGIGNSAGSGNWELGIRQDVGTGNWDFGWKWELGLGDSVGIGNWESGCKWELGRERQPVFLVGIVAEDGLFRGLAGLLVDDRQTERVLKLKGVAVRWKRPPERVRAAGQDDE